MCGRLLKTKGCCRQKGLINCLNIYFCLQLGGLLICRYIHKPKPRCCISLWSLQFSKYFVRFKFYFRENLITQNQFLDTPFSVRRVIPIATPLVHWCYVARKYVYIYILFPAQKHINTVQFRNDNGKVGMVPGSEYL